MKKIFTAHAVGRKNEAYTNAKRVKVNKAKLRLRVNKTFRIKAQAVAEGREKKLLAHAPKLRYYTDDRKVVERYLPIW